MAGGDLFEAVPAAGKDPVRGAVTAGGDLFEVVPAAGRDPFGVR
jgi:hypothetical protein